MPYSSNAELPKSVKGLPPGAQTIWRKAFNASHEKYGEDSARKIAWAAVKKVYKKVGDRWVRSK
jgi:cation transport regulator